MFMSEKKVKNLIEQQIEKDNGIEKERGKKKLMNQHFLTKFYSFLLHLDMTIKQGRPLSKSNVK